MRFACREYKEIGLKDLGSFSEWVDLQNEDYKYCQTVTDVFGFEDKCKDINLPSYHPYWGFVAHKRAIELIDIQRGMIGNYQAAIDRGSYYSSNAQQSIDRTKESLKELILKLGTNFN